MPSFRVFELARKIPRKNVTKTIELVLELISAIRYWRPKLWIFMFLRRSGAHIFELNGSKFCTGCADYAIAFLTLARACQIPCRLVHALKKDWLKSKKLHIQGHCFVECFDKKQDKWILTDPTKGIVLKELPQEYVSHACGKDLWDINLKSYFHMLFSATRFRKRWKEQNLKK
jgi:hypothetical protein